MCLGIPGKIVEITDSSSNMGLALVSGVKRPVKLACLESKRANLNNAIGKCVLIHVGFAMNYINETEAEKTLSLLKEMGDLFENNHDLEIDKI